MSAPLGEALSARHRAAFDSLLVDLDRIFGTRLRSVVAYGFGDGLEGDDLRTMAIVEAIGAEDLHRLAARARDWKAWRMAVPLFLTHDELTRTLDVFPLEYGNIIARHVPLRGDNPFAGLAVDDADRRRGCEHDAKSHLIHLREGFIESEGDPARVARLIAASAPAFRSVLRHIVRLEWGKTSPRDTPDDHALAEAAATIIGVPAELVTEVLASGRSSSIADPSPLLARYLAASEQVWRYVDGWRT